MSHVKARAISAELRRRGFTWCTASKVLAVARGESLLDDPALESAILQELE